MFSYPHTTILLTSILLLIGLLSSALGEEPSQQKKREAWMDASEYSDTHPGVAFAVNGRARNATNQQIVDYITGRLKDGGANIITPFTGREDIIGVSMSFFLQGDAYGPVGFKKMDETIDKVAGHAAALEWQSAK